MRRYIEFALHSSALFAASWALQVVLFVLVGGFIHHYSHIPHLQAALAAYLISSVVSWWFLLIAGFVLVRKKLKKDKEYQ
jgi:hypothetical protein